MNFRINKVNYIKLKHTLKINNKLVKIVKIVKKRKEIAIKN